MKTWKPFRRNARLRSLLGSLRASDGTALLSHTACRFWTEHSDRAGLDGWCMALGVSEPERSFLGRWAAKGSTDAYVRTAVRVVENLQLLAARHARASAAGGPDFYGEEHILHELRRFLSEAGLEKERVDDQVSALTAQDVDDASQLQQPLPRIHFPSAAASRTVAAPSSRMASRLLLFVRQIQVR